MNCASCKIQKIGPQVAPYGGFLCNNEHLQCQDCSARLDGQCAVCNTNTNFVQMNFNSSTQQLTIPAPTAPPMSSEHNFGGTLENNSSLLFPRAFFADIESQSSISKEELSMNDSSRVTISDNAQENQNDEDVKITVGPSANSGECIQMETIFFGNNQQEESASNFTFQFCAGAIPVAATTSDNVEHGKNIEEESGSNGIVLLPSKNAKKVKDKNLMEEMDEIIHTSEIRFMDSTESLQNYYSGGTTNQNLKAKQNKQKNHQDVLSSKMLQDYECHNTAHPSELIENYLRSYGPLAVCHFPMYGFNSSTYYQSVPEQWNMQQQQQQSPVRSISVSTESEPSLAGTAGAMKKTDLPAKYFPPDYFVLQATCLTTNEPAMPKGIVTSDNKIAHPSIDIRMQKVLETLQEHPQQPKISEKKLELSKNFIKIPTLAATVAASVSEAAVATTPLVPPVATTMDEISSCRIPDKISTDEYTATSAQLSNSHRAFYNPPSNKSICQLHHKSSQVIEPPPQFQLIDGSAVLSNNLVSAHKSGSQNRKGTPACQLNIPRSPIQCPDSVCQRMIFVSDFSKHLIVDHSTLPMERITPGQCKNFFLDPRLSHVGISKCHLMYLIRDKIMNLGSGKFKDYLPLLVMTTCIKLSELCGVPDNLICNNVQFLMIWLTGIVPEELPVSVSLTVWSRSAPVPTCHLVHSGKMYSVRQSQKVYDICQSGQMLLLSSNEVQMLTNGGKDMLELQIIVH